MIIPPAIHNDCSESVSNPADFITDEKKLPGAKSRRVSPYKMTSIIIAHKNWKSKGKKAEIFWKQSGKKLEQNRKKSGSKPERKRKKTGTKPEVEHLFGRNLSDRAKRTLFPSLQASPMRLFSTDFHNGNSRFFAYAFGKPGNKI